ncbi:Lon protease-like protein, mitochondrial [Scheffersomyces amazonensis]|uniref:Lon protease-like protein, mitochondrial n=1 Tax=Scheffersomyces amazonensis TaxID=1078765 RepID=UPI00315CDCC5
MLANRSQIRHIAQISARAGAARLGLKLGLGFRYASRSVRTDWMTDSFNQVQQYRTSNIKSWMDLDTIVLTDKSKNDTDKIVENDIIENEQDESIDEKEAEKEQESESDPEPDFESESDKSSDIVENIEKDSNISGSSTSSVGAASGASGNGNGSGSGKGKGNDDGNDDDLTGKHKVNQETGLYPPLLAIPMKDRPPLPGRPFAINLTDSEVINSIYTIEGRGEGNFVLFHVKDQNEPDADVIQSKNSVHTIGVHCHILKHSTPKAGVFNLVGYPLERCQLEELSTPKMRNSKDYKSNPLNSFHLNNFKVSYATVKPVKDEPYDIQSTDITSLVESLKSLLGKLGSKNPLEKLQIKEGTIIVNDPSRFADFVGSTIHGNPKQIQEILEAINIETRLQRALELLKVELKANKIKESTIHNLSSKADELQTRLFIREFIKELQKRAGIVESDDKTSKFDERIKHLKLTDEALEAYNTEKAKLNAQSEHSGEASVIERYLDWLTSIPWGIYTKDRFNIREARKILDRDHYGLKDVKERILEFISQGRISGKVDGKILCLAGPPGTGKTSIAKSIAEALDRRYVRIAMGGIQDVHEVKGHRRTYVGSVPGRIILALKQAKTSNPLMLIDEIDKLDLSRSGGAASAFLEILDPEQNHAFVDTFMDVKVDLSKVLFVCTANYLGNIPPPLRDRMEIIDVSGYSNNEKIEIAKRHLIPDASKKAGLEEGKVNISTETIARLIDKYCRESGLRNVKKLIQRIFSKASLKIVEEVEARDEANPKPEVEVAAATTVKTEEIETNVKEEATTKTVKSKAKEEKKSKAKEKGKEKEKVKEKEKEKGTASLVVEEPIEEPEPVKLDIPEDIVLNITPSNLKDYVGPEIYTRARVYDLLPAGVATGLSYSTSGNGDALYIESILTQSIGSGSGHAGMHVTGSLKDVMKESASIAYSFTKSYMVKNFPENRFFEAAEVHVHCPDGAIPKDGPSAGIAFTSSLISLALNKSIPPTIAMTGEITVTGRVLAVGGLREKILGAKRYGYDQIIFPKDIENELEEIPQEVKEGVTFYPVEWYQEVFDKIFPDIQKDEANQVWKQEFAKLEEKKAKHNSKK